VTRTLFVVYPRHIDLYSIRIRARQSHARSARGNNDSGTNEMEIFTIYDIPAVVQDLLQTAAKCTPCTRAACIDRYRGIEEQRNGRSSRRLASNAKRKERYNV